MNQDPSAGSATFFKVSCLDASMSPDARCKLDAETDKLANELRDHPTLPADPQDANKPSATALREDAAVELPAKHCAFRGCLWTGRYQSELDRHLMQQHPTLLETLASSYPHTFTAEERAHAAYNSALSVKAQESAPLASYAIDRRCIYEYVTSLGDEKVDSLICLICARRFPYVSAFHKNEINWSTPLQDGSTFLGLDATSLEDLLGYQTYLKSHGRCPGRGMPNLTEHPEDFEDWLTWVSLNDRDVQILCCPEDVRCGDGACAERRRLCHRCQVPMCHVQFTT